MALRREVEQRGLRVDVLVNNAGLGSFGEFADVAAATDMNLVAVNIAALTHLTKLFLPDMVARRAGRIMNVASTAGFVPGPKMAVYYASKAYVLSLSVAIADEVADRGVTVSCLCPGATRSDFDKTAGNDKSKMFASGVMDAATVARVGVEGMLRGRVIIVPGLKNRVLSGASGWLPRPMLARFARRYQEPAAD